MPRSYPFAIEFAGRFGMFARADTGSEPCSYEVPTKSVAKGMIESISRLAGAVVEPVAVGMCNSPQWLDYAFNSYSPHRKRSQRDEGNPCQIRTSILENPRYVILGLIHGRDDSWVNEKDKYRNIDIRINQAHFAQQRLLRRVKKGVYREVPVMGWKDFPVNDISLQKTSIISYNSVIPIFLSVASYEYSSPVFQRNNNVAIKNGILVYGEEKVKLKNENGINILTFDDPKLDKLLDEFRRIK